MDMESTPLSEHGRSRSRSRLDRNQDNKETCHKYTKMYSKKFEDVSYISSEDLVEMTSRQGTGHGRIVLVDVRTEPERQVSMLEGAVSKADFLGSLASVSSSPTNTDTTGDIDNDNHNDEAPMIVIYCTIGYRSGLEARRLGLQYPHLKHRIASLDGIVSYTHALGETESFSSDDEHQAQKRLSGDKHDLSRTTATDKQGGTASPVTQPPQLVHPQSGQPTTHVHVFGPMWGCVDDNHFETTHFSFPELLVRLVQVFMAILSCFCLRILHVCCGGAKS